MLLHIITISLGPYAAHGCESPILIQDSPISFNEGNELIGMRRVKVRNIQVFG